MLDTCHAHARDYRTFFDQAKIYVREIESRNLNTPWVEKMIKYVKNKLPISQPWVDI